jgi:hypothetical protein
MNVTEETIDAMLDSNGQLRLTHQPRLPPGPVRVTIRVGATVGPQRGLADVIREIAAEQRSRGFPGRSSEDLRSEDDARLAEDAERDRELDAARRGSSSGGPWVLYYLDTVIVICAVEGNSADQQRALNHLAALERAGHRFAINELTLTECLVPVLGPGSGQRLSDFFRFFRGPNLRTLDLTAATYARASAIRGGHTYPAIPPAQPKRYGLADALHRHVCGSPPTRLFREPGPINAAFCIFFSRSITQPLG